MLHPSCRFIRTDGTRDEAEIAAAAQALATDLQARCSAYHPEIAAWTPDQWLADARVMIERRVSDEKVCWHHDTGTGLTPVIESTAVELATDGPLPALPAPSDRFTLTLAGAMALTLMEPACG